MQGGGGGAMFLTKAGLPSFDLIASRFCSAMGWGKGGGLRQPLFGSGHSTWATLTGDGVGVQEAPTYPPTQTTGPISPVLNKYSGGN